MTVLQTAMTFSNEINFNMHFCVLHLADKVLRVRVKESVGTAKSLEPMGLRQWAWLLMPQKSI